MKLLTTIAFCLLFFCIPSVQAQQEYTIDGKVYNLKSAVKGELELLWTEMDGLYHFFLKKDDQITELKNTKIDGYYHNDYKRVLEEQTADVDLSTKRVSLTLLSLHNFIVEYNTIKDPEFFAEKKSAPLQLWIGTYGGTTNSIFTDNVTNESQPVVGLELEVIDTIKLRRHTIVLDLRNTFKGDVHKYSSTQFGLSYRFKFLKTMKFDMFLNTKFVTFAFFEKEIYDVDENTPVKRVSGKNYTTPLTFGLGADYKVGKGYLTFGYHDFASLMMESNDENPLDFSLGYKFQI